MAATTETETPTSADGTGGDAGYSDEERPLRAYAGLTAGFAAGFVGALVLAKRSGRELPEGLGPMDVVTAGAATHKLSRLISKDKATSFLRAPFVRYEQGAGHGELSEQPRGSGIQLAVGELLGCPYCLGQWIAASIGVGYVAAPRMTRLVTFIYTAETVGDFLQLAYRTSVDKAP